MKREKKECENCFYFRYKGYMGECVRHAPVLNPFQYDSCKNLIKEFPSVYSSDYCGDWKKKKGV